MWKVFDIVIENLFSFPEKLETHIFLSSTRKIQNPLKPEPTPSPTHPIIQICLFFLSFCYLSSVVCLCLLSAVAAGCLSLRISGKHWICWFHLLVKEWNFKSVQWKLKQKHYVGLKIYGVFYFPQLRSWYVLYWYAHMPFFFFWYYFMERE